MIFWNNSDLNYDFILNNTDSIDTKHCRLFRYLSSLSLQEKCNIFLSEADRLHYRINIDRNGNLFLCHASLKAFYNWPSSTIRIPCEVCGGIVNFRPYFSLGTLKYDSYTMDLAIELQRVCRLTEFFRNLNIPAVVLSDGSLLDAFKTYYSQTRRRILKLESIS